MNFKLSKPIARLIWPRIKREFEPCLKSVYAHGLSLDPWEIHSGTCHWGKPKCSKKTLWGCRSKLGPYRRRNRFAGRDSTAPSMER